MAVYVVDCLHNVPAPCVAVITAADPDTAAALAGKASGAWINDSARRALERWLGVALRPLRTPPHFAHGDKVLLAVADGAPDRFSFRLISIIRPIGNSDHENQKNQQ
ncbi:MAG: hypothetical protein ACUVSX_15860 [Aggregatilineales bacterium]